MRPETLPPDFYSFMVKAARCPQTALELNAANIRGGPVNAENALLAIKKLRPTKHALQAVGQMAGDANIVTW